MLLRALLLTCVAYAAFGAVADDKETQLEIEHSLSSAGGKRAFTSRGSLFYKDPRTTVQDGTKKSPLHTSKTRLAGADLKLFQKLVEEDGNYLVRIKNPSGGVVTAYARACALVASGFREEWAVTMDASGHVVALAVSPKVKECDASTRIGEAVQFETSVRLAYPWRGIRPDVPMNQGGAHQQPTQPGQQQQKQPKGADGKESEPQEEKTFLQKYWLYLAIPGVFMMMNGLPPEEGAGGSKPGTRAPPRRRPA